MKLENDQSDSAKALEVPIHRDPQELLSERFASYRAMHQIRSSILRKLWLRMRDEAGAQP
jgi:hypothetical protein